VSTGQTNILVAEMKYIIPILNMLKAVTPLKKSRDADYYGNTFSSSSSHPDRVLGLEYYISSQQK
jgi:hypothetical protein